MFDGDGETRAVGHGVAPSAGARFRALGSHGNSRVAEVYSIEAHEIRHVGEIVPDEQAATEPVAQAPLAKAWSVREVAGEEGAVVVGKTTVSRGYGMNATSLPGYVFKREQEVFSGGEVFYGASNMQSVDFLAAE